MSVFKHPKGSAVTLTHVFVFDYAAEVLWILYEARQARVFIGGRRAGTKVHEAQ